MRQNIEQYMAFKRGEIRMPDHLKPRKELTTRLFKSDFMEAFTRTPIWVPQVMYVVLIVLFFWYGITRLGLNILIMLPVAAGGFLFWTFAEYMIHRFLYHTESESETLNNIQYKGHTVHHQYPIDPTRLAMPPLPSIILSGLFLGLFYLLMGKWAVAFWPGFIAGYLVYITFHYYQHRIKSPRIPTLKKLWLYHQIHHYSNPYAAFGVSTLLWDYVFGTIPEIKKGRTKK